MERTCLPHTNTSGRLTEFDESRNGSPDRHQGSGWRADRWSDAYGCVPVPNRSSLSIARHASSGGTGGDPYRRRPRKRRAVSIQGRPVDGLIACAACPCGVPAAVAEAGLVPDEHLSGAEPVPVRAVRRRVSDPLPGGGL